MCQRALRDAITAVYSAARLAPEVKALITEKKDERQNGTIRALKIFYAAAGGTIPELPEQPESLFHAKILSTDLWYDDRPEYVRHLYESLRSYLTSTQQNMIKTFLATYKGSALKDLQQDLEKQLCALDAATSEDDGHGGKYFRIL